MTTNKRLGTTEEVYSAMQDALDLIKACQAAGLRGVDVGSLDQIGDARAALDCACRGIEQSRKKP